MKKNVIRVAAGSLGVVVLAVLAGTKMPTEPTESEKTVAKSVEVAAAPISAFTTEFDQLVFGMHFQDLNKKELKPVEHVEEAAAVSEEAVTAQATPEAVEVTSEPSEQPTPEPNQSPRVAQAQPTTQPQTEAPAEVPVYSAVESPGEAVVEGITVTPTQEPETEAATNGSYSKEEQMASIQGGCYIMGTTYTYLDQMIRYYNANQVYPEFYKNTDAPTIEAFCQIYIEEAQKEGVRAEVAFCQAMKETGFLRYLGDVRIEQYNFAGIGATGGGVQGNYFANVRTGIRAQIQHLKAYASTEALKGDCVDPRFHYVNRGTTPYVEWLGIHENPFGGGWAAAVNYGYSIIGDYLTKLFSY